MTLVVADESVDRRLIVFLRERSFSVFSIFEEIRGIADRQVLELAVQKDAMLITQDKDFGELVINLGLPHRGILLLRFGNLSLEEKLMALKEGFLKNPDALKGNFAVLDKKQLRIRKLL